MAKNNGQLKTKLHFQRFEFKYQVPMVLVQGIIAELLKYMEFDPFAKDLPGQSYTVASLYFDSAGLGCYYDKVAGLRTRKKLRARFYDFNLKPETPVFLEIKRKHDAVVIKDRIKLNYQSYRDLFESSETKLPTLSAEEQDTFAECMWFKQSNGMLPQVMVAYQRIPMQSKIDPGFRVTIDHSVRAYRAQTLAERAPWLPVSSDIAIIEVKFNNSMPRWFHSVIERYNLMQQPFSKYSRALEVCHPLLALRAATVAEWNAATAITN